MNPTRIVVHNTANDASAKMRWNTCRATITRLHFIMLLMTIKSSRGFLLIGMAGM